MLEDVPELMSVAQKSGKLLAHRIFQRINVKMTEEEIFEKVLNGL
jgi:hypothetical protein